MRFPRPALTHDCSFFWGGTKKRRLLIQRCRSCGRLRHPPGPMCPACQSLKWDTLQARGRGHVYSFVIAHHPPIPPFEYPHAIGLIELEEGTRLIAGLVDVEPHAVRIGMPVELSWREIDAELVLPVFRPTTGGVDP